MPAPAPLGLEIAFAGERPLGAVVGQDGRRRRFDGWAELATAIVAVANDHRPSEENPHAPS